MIFEPGMMLRCIGTPELVKIVTRDFQSAEFGLVVKGVTSQWKVLVLWLGPCPWIEEVNPDWLTIRYRPYND